MSESESALLEAQRVQREAQFAEENFWRSSTNLNFAQPVRTKQSAAGSTPPEKSRGFNILNGAAEAGPAPEVKPAKADQKGPNNFNIISWGEKIGAQYTKPSPQ